MTKFSFLVEMEEALQELKEKEVILRANRPEKNHGIQAALDRVVEDRLDTERRIKKIRQKRERNSMIHGWWKRTAKVNSLMRLKAFPEQNFMLALAVGLVPPAQRQKQHQKHQKQYQQQSQHNQQTRKIEVIGFNPITLAMEEEYWEVYYKHHR